MDITKFNKELSKKIRLAKSLENRKEVEAAIKLWLEISEMTLNLLKSKNLESSFKLMLMNRTKGIFEHIKQLKGNKKGVVPSLEQIVSQPELDFESFSNEKLIKSSTSDENEIQIQNQEKNDDYDKVKVIQDSEFKNIPSGFKEIKASEDFDIITPHDKDYVKKLLNQENHSVFSNKKEEIEPRQVSASDQNRFDFEQPEDGKKVICFACGAEISKNKKICSNCGANLE